MVPFCVRVGAKIAGRYRLVERVGAGSNGVVWQAVDEELERTVALKRALPGESGKDQLERLRAEARLLARLNHRHVVTLYDVVADGDEFWLVMEYLAARSLADRDVLPAATVARIGAQLADALAALHTEGILHRDVKPGNVLLVSDDDAKLADFGLSRVLAGDETMTGSALLGGTPGYVAPEVANGEEPAAASDVFSLGSTLFAALTGKSPVGADTDNPFLRLRRAARGHVDRADGPLGPALNRMLAVDPRKRPSAAEARSVLEAVAEGEAPPVQPSRRHRGVLVTAGAFVVVVAVGAWWMLTPFDKVDKPVPLTGSPLGEPRTADPCSLFNQATLRNFGGTPNLVKDEYNFEQCNMIIKPGDGTEADVTMLLAVTEPGTDDNLAKEDHGRFQIVREPSSGGSCVRRLLLPDRYEVRIQAVRQSFLNANVCGMADAATESAAAVMDRGEIPRRQPPQPGSYFTADACAAANSQRFPAVAGIDKSNPKIGFGRWSCTWTTPDRLGTFHVDFGRHNADPVAGQVVQIAGRSATVLVADEEDPDYCQVDVDGRRYRDDYGDWHVEEMFVVVDGKAWPRDTKCQLAKELATASFPPR